MKSKQELIRVVRLPDGTVVTDSTGKKSGRGAYLCRDASCLAKAVRSGALERSLKIRIPEDVYTSLQNEIVGMESGA